MAVKTACQTPGAQFHTEIESESVTVKVDFGMTIPLTEEGAKLLESNLHNALELVFSRYYA